MWFGDGEWKLSGDPRTSGRRFVLCLANKNKEGISTHYHLLTLVSTTTCLPGNPDPGMGIWMENGDWPF